MSSAFDLSCSVSVSFIKYFQKVFDIGPLSNSIAEMCPTSYFSDLKYSNSAPIRDFAFLASYLLS